MEVCKELAFHGIELLCTLYFLSVSVADWQVLHVDVEKVKVLCTSRNARLSAQRSALHDAGASATPCAHSRVVAMCRRSMRAIRRRRTCTP